MTSKRPRTELTSPKSQPNNPSDALEEAFTKIVPNRMEAKFLLANLFANSSFYNSGMPSVIDCNSVPMHYLPPRFSRRVIKGKGPRILFDERFPLSDQSMICLQACISASAMGSTTYYLDEQGFALVIPRSYSTETAVHFDNVTLKRTTGDNIQPLLKITSAWVASASPLSSQLVFLLKSLRDVHKTKCSDAVVTTLGSVPATAVVQGLVDLLSSSQRHISNLSASLLSCIVDEKALSALQEMAEGGQIDIELFYRIVSVHDLMLPITTFPKSQGLDERGAALEQKRLGDCDPSDHIVVSKKVVTLSAFKALSLNSLVTAVPDEGMYRMGPKKDKRNTFVKMECDVTEAASLSSLVRAIQGASGQRPQDKEAKEEKQEMDEDELEEEL